MTRGFEHKQHIRHIDSYFTSLDLLAALKQRGILC
jgi:hypothetical protein